MEEIMASKAAVGGARPMFLTDWKDVLFIHFRVDPWRLQEWVPLRLDLREGRAYVSVVAFTQKRFRPAMGGAAAEFLSRPLAGHEFLNLRTYVVHDGEAGVYFLEEWISNRLAVFLGPRVYGLPYRLGRMSYQTGEGYAMRQVVAGGHFACVAKWNAGDLATASEVGSEAEFLLERYTAFTVRGGKVRRFRITHEPWRKREAEVAIERGDLLGDVPMGDLCGAHYSAGLGDVGISWCRTDYRRIQLAVQAGLRSAR
jgi:uncharacterized protein YqjF (DUF2071 family)